MYDGSAERQLCRAARPIRVARSRRRGAHRSGVPAKHHDSQRGVQHKRMHFAPRVCYLPAPSRVSRFVKRCDCCLLFKAKYVVRFNPVNPLWLCDRSNRRYGDTNRAGGARMCATRNHTASRRALAPASVRYTRPPGGDARCVDERTRADTLHDRPRSS